jgi:hypothetical protein
MVRRFELPSHATVHPDRAVALHGCFPETLPNDPSTRKSNAAIGSERNMSSFDEFYCRAKYHPT